MSLSSGQGQVTYPPIMVTEYLGECTPQTFAPQLDLSVC